ncbi:hypothetical protein D3C76_680990 [compost metagenome]
MVGSLPAILVKSRKPPAAYRKISRFSLRLASESTRPKASRCGRWLVAASTSSWRSTGMCSTSASSARHRRSTLARASGSVSGSGVRMTLWRRNRVALEASTPLCSDPAIGWPGTKRDSRPPSTWRAARTTLPLALPTSVITALPRSSGARRARSFSMARMGTANWMTSAPTQAAARSSSQRSTTPRATACLREGASRSTPTTSRHRPLSRRPLAKEPPIRPRPTTTRRPMIGAGLFVTASTTSANPVQKSRQSAGPLGLLCSPKAINQSTAFGYDPSTFSPTASWLICSSTALISGSRWWPTKSMKNT